MAPLIVLLLVHIILRYAAPRLPTLSQHVTTRHPAAFALAAMWAFTGSSHFFMTEELALMIPPAVGERHLLVIVSGAAELMLALALTQTQIQKVAAQASVLMLLCCLPLNVYAASAGVGPGGHSSGIVYLWFRVPLQLFFIGWAVAIARPWPFNRSSTAR